MSDELALDSLFITVRWMRATDSKVAQALTCNKRRVIGHTSNERIV